MIEGIRTINRFQNEEFSRFIDRLGKIPEGEGSLLDHTMILFGSAIRDGNRHDHDDLPILMAGGEALACGMERITISKARLHWPTCLSP